MQLRCVSVPMSLTQVALFALLGVGCGAMERANPERKVERTDEVVAGEATDDSNEQTAPPAKAETEVEPGKLRLAALDHRTAEIERLLDLGADPNERDVMGTAPLHVAVEFASSGSDGTDSISLLLDRGANPNAQDSRHKTPLHLVENGAYTRLLLQRGADPSLQDKMGSTPFHWAVLRGRSSVVKALLAGNADVDVVDSSQKTPLFMSVGQIARVEVTQLLLAAGARVDAMDDTGRMALHHAAGRGHVEAIHMLVNGGASPSQLTRDGATPLHFAAAYGRGDAVTALLELGADRTVRDKDGRTPIERAQQAPAFRITLAGKVAVDTTEAVERLR